MSKENVDTVREVFELFRNRDSTAERGFGEADVAKALELLHPDFELDATRVPMTDLRGRYRGPIEVADFWRRWLEAWESHEFGAELTGAGDRVFAEMGQQRMRGNGSGVEVSLPPVWQVFTLREGRVIGQTFYLDEAEAREAAGLSE
jgi:ketosteroid isomerase-like protein